MIQILCCPKRLHRQQPMVLIPLVRSMIQIKYCTMQLNAYRLMCLNPFSQVNDSNKKIEEEIKSQAAIVS